MANRPRRQGEEATGEALLRRPMDSWTYLKAICRWPHRGSTSPWEHEAAGWLASTLQGLGLEVRQQPLRAPAATLYAGPAVSGGVAALCALGAAWVGQGPAVVAAAVLAVVALVPLVGEVTGSRINFDHILPRRPSFNVVADLPTRRAGADGAGPSAASPELVIVAHYDTQRASWLFAPGFSGVLPHFFRLAYACLALAVLGLLGGAVSALWAPGWQGWRWAAGVGGAASALAVGWMGLGGLVGRPVNGANDNGSGVAVALALARRYAGGGPHGVRMRWVFTGCEEVGTRGMRAFMDAQYPRRAPAGGLTLFVNLDNVGGGRLRALLYEGMLTPVRCGRVLGRLAEELSREHPDRLSLWPRMLLLPTDGLVPAQRGYEVLTFIGLDERGRIPDYHWYTDTVERIDPARLRDVEQTVGAFVEAAARWLAAGPGGGQGQPVR